MHRVCNAAAPQAQSVQYSNIAALKLGSNLNKAWHVGISSYQHPPA